MNDRTELEVRHTEVSLFSLTPSSLAEALELAKLMSDSDMVPKDYRGKPGNCLIAVQMGLELGLKPMQAIQGIAIINGRPSLWGDALWALVKSHPLCEFTEESYNAATQTATCVVKRKGAEPVVRTFSKEDAVKAKLWGKEGPWTNYPPRMLQMRARGFACRDAIPEALKGFRLAEEARDTPPEKDMGSADRVEHELALRNCVSLEELKACYDALTDEEKVRMTPVVTELKKKLKAATAGTPAAVEPNGAPPEITLTDAVAKLASFTDFDKMAEWADQLSGTVTGDDRFATAFKKRLDEIRAK